MLMLTCKQASQLVSKSLELRLSWSERMQLKLHLVICAACRQFKQQLNLLHVALQRSVKEIESDRSIQLSIEVKERIKVKVAQASSKT